jgi:hypothetical protein
MACHMSLKIHFLLSHPDLFPENLGEFSDELSEPFDKTLSQWNTAIKFSGKTI